MPIKDWSIYPANWKTEIRPAILERAGHKCETCKSKNTIAIFRGFMGDRECYQDIDGNIYDAGTGEFLKCDCYESISPSTGNENQKAIRVVLTIAHIDHDTTNNEPSNLKALCQRCHLRLDADLHRESSRKTRERKGKLQRMF